ncbi:hypothetical protein D0504_08140 [Weissella confusa]|uniref:SpaA isopeptide-forming pilin-related protein n=1 Tax=Weissella confusa TaxID=1583 RepID=UPI0021C10218|nr:SpaA isopeptide-forming pilin-related protein [Weissella confusa]MCT8393679.1 hypothetical protein [Weissella confusa]
MAKWKNALLISTIVAPIAFGAGPIGDAFAQADRPGKNGTADETVVQIHKYIKSTTDGTGSQNVVWGDGTAGTGTVLENNGFALAKQTYTFTAYQIPNSAIKIDNDKSSDTYGQPIITGDWADYFEVVEASDPNQTGHDTTNVTNAARVNQYTIALKADADVEAMEDAVEAANAADPTLEKHVAATTNGVATFQDGINPDNGGLENGNWVIIETGSQESTKEKSTPMVLSLPMMKGAADGGWFGSQTTNDYLHLYPKNYADRANLKVLKKNAEDNTGVDGAKIALLKGLPAADIQALIDTAKFTDAGVVSDEGTKSFYDLEVTQRIAALKAAGITVVQQVVDSANVDYLTTGGDDHSVTFTDLDPEATYYVLEIDAPTDYDVNGTVQEVTLEAGDDYEDDKTVGTGESPTVVYYQGSEYNLTNYDEPDVDKQINVNSPVNELSTDTTLGDTFEQNDDTIGVTRGQEFQYLIKSELNKDFGTYNSYSLTDTIPYQVNVRDVTLGLELNGDYVPLFVAHDPKADDPDTYGGVNYNSDATDTTTTFKFASEDAATILGYTGAYDDDNVDAYIKTLVKLFGTTSKYGFTDDTNRAVDPTQTAPGTMTIEMKAPMIEKLGVELESQTTANNYLTVILDSKLNAAGQAGTLTNEIDLSYRTKYEPGTSEDKTSTFTAGWEFLKKNGDGEKLANAGFDLRRDVSSASDVQEVKAALLTEAHLPTSDGQPTTFTDKSKADMVAAINQNRASDDQVTWSDVEDMLNEQDSKIDTDAEVYFVHLDKDNQPVIEMSAAGMGSDEPMGAIFWTTIPELATTHITTDDGYLQYCGLSAGRYALLETEVPAGYVQMAEQKFTLSGYETNKDGSYVLDANNQKIPTLAETADYPYLGPDGQVAMATDDKISGTDEDGDMVDNTYVTIVNEKKSIFPLVGGLGTMFAVIAGLLAMGLALLKRKKDMKNEA